MKAYTASDVKAAKAALDGLLCDCPKRPATREMIHLHVMLDAVAPAVVARAKAEVLRDEAVFIDKLRASTSKHVAEYLRKRADEIERGES